MTWAYFDDGAPKHPKARAAGNEAWGLWAAAVMYCNRWLTDGRITLDALASDCLPVPIPKAKAKRLAEKLCAAKLREDGVGLLEDIGSGAYNVHDFLEWNKSKAEVEAKRAADRARKKNGGSGGSGAPVEPPSSPHGSPPAGGSDSARNSERKSERIPDGSGADSASRADARGGPRVRVPPSPPLPSQPSHPSQQALAGRLVDTGLDPDGIPKPRHDPMHQRVGFEAWFPSQALLDWARRSGLEDRRFDEAVGDARNKLRGPGDFDWWDTKVLSFLRAAIERHGHPADASEDARQAALDAQHEAKVAQLRAEARERRQDAGEPVNVRALAEGIGG